MKYRSRRLLSALPDALSVSRGLTGLCTLLFLPTGAVLITCLLWGALSDFLDGFLARRFGWRTELGASIDLYADGVFFLSALLCFWQHGVLPGHWLALILVLSIPELAAQAILFVRGPGVGSQRHLLNKLLGAYSYFFVLALPMGGNVTILATVQVVGELAANGRDLYLALAWRNSAGPAHEEGRAGTNTPTGED